ncbi:MAG: alpha/beta hydrolase [Rhodospirillaceae bacterium]|jgi:pimeloyl-ACP methyl ester carboxylesterase|nr:alpha/beta hydrolase [Rhodospirillaceae bacterium]MBT5240934.1 alpha/beta hydrolase [Rhodospirillaceae bacterium]MBT5564550.1 alpha/beta hydrolase [Rhodospirillaceae bacterium]MBT6090885.1 alpha/beta hydrolase [Rhodospirillaceae bacterium]MBT7450666.1 alpha/beta hydrolase [Rhodospirillaceae bacterium]
MAEITTRRFYVDGPYGQVHIREARPKAGESNKTPLICFHQSPVSGAQYRPFQDEMAVDRIVWCPDTPGFGGSDAPSDVVTIGDYANAMATVIDGLGYGASGKGAIDIFGGHTGSVIGTELALTRSDLVRKIAYPSVALFSDEQKTMMMQRFGGPPGYFTDPNFVAETYKQTVLDGHPELGPERRLELFTERLRSGLKAWYAPEAVMSYDAEGQLQKLSQPALLLVLDDMLADNTRLAGTLIPNATIVEMTQIPHALAWDIHAAEIAEAVRAFYDKP